MNEPKVYQYKSFRIIIFSILMVIIFIFLLLNVDPNYSYFQAVFIVMIGIILLGTLYLITIKTTISESEISTQTIFGIKSLAWNEISRVSGKGDAIKLHNFDGNVSITPSSSLPGYTEVVDWINDKRSDLFYQQRYDGMSKSQPGKLLLTMMVPIFFIGLEIFIFFVKFNNYVIPLFLTLIIIGIYTKTILAGPQSISVQGSSITISYLFKQKTLRADEISSIYLTCRPTKGENNYCVVIKPENEMSFRISRLNLSIPIVYLVLKNWHKKYTEVV